MNKKKLGIVIDSTIGSYLDKSIFPYFEIDVVPISIIADNRTFLDSEFNNELMMSYLKEGKEITTSQPNPQLFLKSFKKQLELGCEHIFCLTLSKKLSGTFYSAQKAQKLLNVKNITVLDTDSIGPGMFFSLKKIYEYFTSSNFSYDEIFQKVTEIQKQNSILFVLDDLKQLSVNNRINRFQMFIGSLFKIKPILRMNQGVISIEKKVRSINNCIRYLVEYILNFRNKQKNGFIEVNIIYVYDDIYAQQLKKEIQKLNCSKIKISMYGQVSTVIAIHLRSKAFGFYLNRI
ncbi:DegV family EDD domain-containing protein [Texas Phoenix palm phytoplasma]|uniref:DegV family EDD domain-containing protein n=1 Tax=Texas Phoenix palm phytoplasma TaxID=176709 RepID=A0ABS5BIZ9_9MOLU|nr:DegV family protein [Texas Phoenix palm phytoplasma]MBP3059540.1 DegV family EDD domain-containing protein [Texas Phoenix palm phytoplasma]